MTICANDILAHLEEIPPLPSTVATLITAVNDPNSTVQDIVEIIKYDQAVTSQMLRICNSAYFGLSREIRSLDEALRYLGTVRVLQLVMSVHGKMLLSKAQSGYGLDPGVLWKHSVAVALASSAFAERIIVGNNSAAFTAGLLHDIGKVVLNEYVGEKYEDIIKIVTQEQRSFIEAEQEVLGFSHDTIGAQLAEMWKLPKTIVRCIRYHHQPSALVPADSLADVVYLANCVCLLLGIGLGVDELLYRTDAQVLDRYCLEQRDLEFIGANTMNELNRIEQMFADII